MAIRQMNLKNILIFVCVCVCVKVCQHLILCLGQKPQAPIDHPNVIYTFSDDMGHNYLDGYYAKRWSIFL